MSTETPASDDIRVLIVDDHQMVAQGLARIIRDEPGLELLGVEFDIAGAIARLEKDLPDVVLMDYILPDGDGAQATEIIRDRWPGVEVLMLSGFGSEDILLRSLESGAIGMLSKTRPAEDVVGAVRAASRGQAVMRLNELTGLIGKVKKPGVDGSASLTKRELGILQSLAKGKSTEAIATELYLSVVTVRNHIGNILSKLGAHSKLEAVIFGVRQGLISQSDIG